MKLQILVPQYNETDEVVKPLLDSIAIQQNVPMDEISVIICNDGSDVFLSDKLLNSYPFKVEYHKEPHKGVSATRNACLDYATADYVQFCDADDMFFNALGIWMICQTIKEKKPDVITSLFIEETRNPKTKQAEYTTREFDGVFVHGKIFKRSYLIENGIRFNEELFVHEDSYFITQATSFTKNIQYCSNPFYAWRWRDESVCRHDPKYILKTFNDLLKSMDASISRLLFHKKTKDATGIIANAIFTAYYSMNKPEWIDQENQCYRSSTEKYFSSFFKKYKKLWLKMPVQEKMVMSNFIRQNNIVEGMTMEIITIDEWLNHIESLSKGGD